MGGFFSGILSGVKAVFGVGSEGSSNIMKVASGIGGWIDEQDFTAEEKAKYNAEVLSSYGKYMETTVAENTKRSLTRREIAVWVIRTEIGFLVSSAILFKIDSDLSEYLYKIATTTPMDYLVLGIGAFFFGAHIVRATQGK